MLYKNKVITLSAICGGLLLIYIGSFIFDPEKNAARKASWTILSSKDRERIEEIEIFDGKELVTLEKPSIPNGNTPAASNFVWFVSFEDKLFPARSAKIDELLGELTSKSSYSVRSASESAFEKFGLDAKNAKRIALRTGNNSTVLELYVGKADTSGREIYVRKGGEKEVRLGKDIFSPYVESGRTTWMDLRLFPEHDANGLNLEAVQRVQVYHEDTKTDDAEATQKSDFSIVRDGDGWTFETVQGAQVEPAGGAIDKSKTDSFVRGILDSSGEDFVVAMSASDPPFGAESAGGRIVIEDGKGKRYVLTLGPVINDKKTLALQDGEYVYALADWTVNRLWKDRAELTE